MTCKDCLHYEVCVIVEHSEATYEDYFTEFGCEDFKDRTKWAEQKHRRCGYCRWASYTDKPFKVITQMGREVEVQFNYCPNCGAKMGGK